MAKKKPKLEKLSEKCSQGVLFEHEGYVIREFDKKNFWLESPEGEGCTMLKINLTEWLRLMFAMTFR